MSQRPPKPPWFNPHYEDLERTDEINIFVKKMHEYPGVIQSPKEAEDLRGQWAGPGRPLHVEVGCAEGGFLIPQSMDHPDVDFVGVEIRFKRLHIAAQRLSKRHIDNIRLVRYDAGFLDQLFDDGEIDTLYIFHPDPWPKKRHAKHRLFNQERLELWIRLLAPGGCIELKTDAGDYFEEMKAVVAGEKRITVEVLSEYLQKDPSPAAHLPSTRFEKLFTGKETPIRYMRLRKPATD